MPVPNIFANQSGSIPLSELDENFAAFQGQGAVGTGAGLVKFSASLAYAAGTVGGHLNKIIFVTDYPFLATGDGVTDDSAAIQAALDYATSVGGGWVYLPRGTYLLGTRLIVPGNVKISGAGIGATILKLKSTILNTAANALKTPTGAGYEYNITIEDLEIDGNKAALTPSGITEGEGSGIYMDQVDGLIIRNVYVHDCLDDGMYIVNTPLRALVDGCTAINNGKAGAAGGRGIVFGVSPRDFRISNNVCSGNLLQGILIQSEGGSDAKNFSIVGNIVEGNSSHGIDLTDNVISSVSVVNILIRDAVITGNTVQGNAGYGVRMSENTVANGGGFFGVLQNIVVSGNAINGNTSGGAIVAVSNDGLCKNVTISGNAICGNTGAALTVTGPGCTDTRIAGNNLIGNGSKLTNTGVRTRADIALTWTPVEATIGALTTNASYQVRGDMCFASALMTWPVTADGTQVVINGLPFSTANAEGARQAFITFTDDPTNAGYVLPLLNSTQSQVYRADGTNRATNSDLSTNSIRAEWCYPIA